MPMLRQPAAKCRPIQRLAGLLAPGTAFANTNKKYAVVPVLGASSVTARIKTATQGGTLDIFFVGPDFPVDQAVAGVPVAYASLVGTIYAAGAPTQVTVTGGTETLITSPCLGECYAIILFTGGGTGTITFCDVSTLPVSF